MTMRAKDLIFDSHNDDYPTIYKDQLEKSNQELAAAAAAAAVDEDEANVYVMYVHIKTADGTPVLERGTTFKCDNCVIVVGMMFPEVPVYSQSELKVQMLDGAMRKVNITRELQLERQQKEEEQRKWGTIAAQRSNRQPMYCARSKQIKAAFVLEGTNVGTTVGRQNGSLTVFVTGSVSHLIEADVSDIMGYPFLKLVAPEDITCVSAFFDRLSESTDVMFETFSLLKHPHIIEGDIFVSDEENQRVVVECLGAAVDDGVALLLRKIKDMPPPNRDSKGNYIRQNVEDDYMSLADLVSSDPDTSDAPEWAHLN
ncbi:hypothetical protein H4R20_001079 [Coemansia guatemalensis]|uniref:Uncharacterized protein n=1 Tax=Coemansia guatemalensis TaxID=2761395 RepID=A0A9W8I417_9FUNG|nr:hypothetical protein H4R20_001079 [Coemansia guatemalensis]